MTPEFSRRLALDTIGSAARQITVEADAGECAALAKRFDLMSLDSLHAQASLVGSALGVEAQGRVSAHAVQRCVVTDAPVTCDIDEIFTLRFVAVDRTTSEIEIELGADDCDTIEFDGIAVDLGEAVAQTLCLALPPFPRCDDPGDAPERTWRAGPEAGAFAGLKGLLS